MIEHCCVAGTKREGGRCSKIGRVQVGLGRRVCAHHHRFGWFPVDEIDAVDPAVALRMEAIAADEILYRDYIKEP